MAQRDNNVSYEDEQTLTPVVEIYRWVDYLQLSEALKRADIPFYVKKTNPLMADGFDMMNGPYLILARETDSKKVAEFYRVITETGASGHLSCPACGVDVKGVLECPACGLFLG